MSHLEPLLQRLKREEVRRGTWSLWGGAWLSVKEGAMTLVWRKTKSKRGFKRCSKDGGDVSAPAGCRKKPRQTGCGVK